MKKKRKHARLAVEPEPSADEPAVRRKFKRHSHSSTSLSSSKDGPPPGPSASLQLALAHTVNAAAPKAKKKMKRRSENGGDPELLPSPLLAPSLSHIPVPVSTAMGESVSVAFSALASVSDLAPTLKKLKRKKLKQRRAQIGQAELQIGSDRAAEVTSNPITKSSPSVVKPVAAAPRVPDIVAALTLQGSSRVEGTLREELKKKPSSDALCMAMHHCAGRGLASCVRLLLEHGAPPDGRGCSHVPLRAATINAHVGVCKLLLEHRADPAGATAGVDDLAKYGKLFWKERGEILDLLRAQAQ